MSIPKVGVDLLVPCHVVRIVGVGERELFEDTKVGFNQVEPRSLGRSPGGVNAQFLQGGQKLGMVVNVVEVIEDDVQSLARIAFAQFAKGVDDFGHAAARSENPVEVIGRDILEAQEMFDAVRAVIGGAPPQRSAFLRPRIPPMGRTSKGPHASKQTTTPCGGHSR